VPLEELSDDDLNIFLSAGEKREFIRYKDKIIRRLATFKKRLFEIDKFHYNLL